MSQEVFNATVQNAADAGELQGLQITDAGDGIMVGNDRREAPVSNTTPVERTYTADDIANARRQEKDKLYSQLNEQKDQIAALMQEREERLAEQKKREEEAQKSKAKAEEDAKRKAEEETDLRTLLQQKENEWRNQLEQERQQRETAFALLEQERTFQELNDYRQSRLAEESANIIPELADLVQGNSAEEIEASLNLAKDRSARILESVAEATRNSRRESVGSRVTAPAVGPMDTNSGDHTLSSEDIRNMSINEYAQHRSKLLGKSPTARGMFG